MKNTIAYYYHFMPETIHSKGNSYSFHDNHYQYIFVKCQVDERQLLNIYELSEYLNNSRFYTHYVIKNKDNQLVTLVQNEPYVLLRVNNGLTSQIKFSDLLHFSGLPFTKGGFSFLKRDYWDKLWANKIDYFEYQINQLGRSYPLIIASFSYFVGLVENGISMYHDFYLSNQSLVVSHRRIKSDYTLEELYNPLNYILDYRVRDVAEFFKDEFIKGVDVFPEIVNYVLQNSLSSYEMIMFFIRMFYPSFYFDLYEEIVEQQKKEDELLKIIEKIPEYEQLLKKLYFYFRQYTKMPEISWIKEL